MTRPAPTPCQRCKAELKEARAELDHARQIVGGQPCEHEARLVAAVNKHDEERREWLAERERLRYLHAEERRAWAAQEQAFQDRLERAGREIAQMSTEWQKDVTALAAANALLTEIVERLGIPWGVGNLHSRVAAHLRAHLAPDGSAAPPVSDSKP